MLWVNFRRELIFTATRLVSVIIIASVAVLIFVSLSGVIYIGEKNASQYYEQQNTADYWISGIGLNRADCQKLMKIDGITQLQPQIILEASKRHDDEVALALYGVADGFKINAPVIVEGEYPKDNREMMISSAFAEKHDLAIGDIYEMEINDTGEILKKQICALIKSPECLYHVSASSLIPDFSKYGFAYMKEDAVSDILGKNIYNQICIKTEKGKDEAEIKSEISAALGNKLISVMALKDNISAYHLTEQTNGLRTIASVFPFIFFLVAALIMFSTMSRLIENSRQSIGTLKAIGYCDKTILFYYTTYAALIVPIAVTLGIAPSGSFIIKPIAAALFFDMDLPKLAIEANKMAWLIAALLTAALCIGTAFNITKKALKEKPVECMRPKPPKKVKAVMLEKSPFFWNRLDFSQKYIIRNIFRNKTRALICVIGITGCMTLILTSFAVRDSIDNYLKMLVINEHRYDYLLNFEQDVENAQTDRIRLMGNVADTQYEMTTGIKIYSADKLETTRLVVTDDIAELKLPETYASAPFVLPHSGIVLEKDIADKLKLAKGSIAPVKIAGKSRLYKIEIAEISPDITGAYAGKSYWRSLGKEFIPTAAYVKTNDIEVFGEQISDYDFISSYKKRHEVTDSITSQLSSLSIIVFILIIFGGILALVVLYNLGIMSFYEQVRSLATLLVLGFYDDETAKLLLTENIVFTVLGIVAGIPLGVGLAKFVLDSVGTVPMHLSITPVSYFLSVAITMSFAIFVNIFLGKKMKEIDMLGALKSVE
ncbi:MAG: ABC transporter permease [Firmicutes bacterium]|nr:ABC transporter permease [Bacillota bacterium]